MFFSKRDILRLSKIEVYFMLQLDLGVLDWSLADIMALFQDQAVVGWVLIATGILMAAWLFENITDPIPILAQIFDVLVKIGTYIGFFVGILDILVGYVVWETNPGNMVVPAILILAGFSLVMRVLSKFPLAIVFALAIAAFATFTIYGVLAPYETTPFIGEYVVQIRSLKWMAVIGFIIFAFVYMISGLIMSIINLLGKIFSLTPISVIIGLACIGVGALVFFMPDMLGLTIPWPTS
jgi:hypothetical protein